MLTLYLVRHGHKISFTPDPGLTSLGQKQANQTGLYLKQFSISKIISSPMQRTQETAQHISKHVNAPIETDERLKERLEFDSSHYASIEEFLDEWQKTTDSRDYTPKYGRASNSAGKDIESLINELDHTRDNHIVLVSHGGAIADFLRNVLDNSHTDRLLKQYENGLNYHVAECAVTILHKDQSGLTLKELHYTSHLNENNF